MALTFITLPLDILERIIFSLTDAISFRALGATHRTLRDLVLSEHMQLHAKIHFLHQVVKIEIPSEDGSIIEYRTFKPLPEDQVQEIKIQTLGRKRKRILEEDADARSIQKIESISEIDGRRMIYHILPNRVKHGLYTEWYPGGKQIRKRSVFWEGKEDGMSYTYHPNGQLWRQATFVQGRMEGEYKSWYNDGTMECSTRFGGNEKKVGCYLEWFKSGKLYVSAEYNKYGEEDGSFEMWYESGGRMSTKTYYRGRAVGIWKDWHENGKVMREEEYEGGKIVRVKEWTQDGEERTPVRNETEAETERPRRKVIFETRV